MSDVQEPRWVPAVAVKAIHHQQTLEHGGLRGVRSEIALASSLARPRQRWVYGELGTIPQLAAAYAEAIVRAHPFSDGNKRSGFLVAVVFLGLNGFSFQAGNESIVLTIQRLAAGELPWLELERWFVDNSRANG
ncbi:type II toxin-antitoxin system death-on-curing family toxin [Cyanobium sp. Alchichica 3B3-8F6]|uniref:type II toxin-antitoxin system death-on-curing family toxin n=1 Tax=Synechococcales TaxID=1890424 RepID=UPI000B982D70|nr:MULTISPECIES: type II toxin-antitoxin system death-on-curing family toxin [Synechococcales]MCP9881290.1 type II toxin-antitoxin system death-on-curing family toxin [Cyanobium sp. Alchichica 3B3-8F6]MCP9943099.1 type II toxin-antitoxin system death-on-curing family toxin [Cyanobium sp. ATX 6E8]